MFNSSKFGNAIGSIAKNALGAMLTVSAVAAVERPRPVSEILNVSATFVSGYPQTFPPTTLIRIVEN